MNEIVVPDHHAALTDKEITRDAIDCLLVSCQSGKQFMRYEFGLRADEVVTETQALDLIRDALEE